MTEAKEVEGRSLHNDDGADYYRTYNEGYYSDYYDFERQFQPPATTLNFSNFKSLKDIVSKFD